MGGVRVDDDDAALVVLSSGDGRPSVGPKPSLGMLDSRDEHARSS